MLPCQLQVTGPDSKGVKSKYNAFHIFRNGSTTLSCTAVLLLNTTEGSPSEATPSTTATVVAPVTCLYPFLQGPKRSKLSSAATNDLIPAVSCSVLLRLADAQQLLLQSKGRRSHNGPQHADSANDSLLVRLTASLIRVMKLPTVETTVDRLLLSANANSSNEWKLGWCLADQQPLAAATAAMVGHIALLHVNLLPYAHDMLSSRQAPYTTLHQHTCQAAVANQEAAKCCAEHTQQLVAAPDLCSPLLSAVSSGSGSSSSAPTSTMVAHNQHTRNSCSSQDTAGSSCASSKPSAACTALFPGKAVTITGSPFGCLAEQHFFGAVVTGCVSLVVPTHDSTPSLALSTSTKSSEAAAVVAAADTATQQALLFIVDARCMPGMEGAPICCRSCGALIGLLCVPLSSCTAQAELLLAVSIAHVASTFEGTAHSHLQGVLQSASICRCSRQDHDNSGGSSRRNGCGDDEGASRRAQELHMQGASGLEGPAHAVHQHRHHQNHHQKQQWQQSRNGMSVLRMQTLLNQLAPSASGAPASTASSSHPLLRIHQPHHVSSRNGAGSLGCSADQAASSTTSDASSTSKPAQANGSVAPGTAGRQQTHGAPMCSISTAPCSHVAASSPSSSVGSPRLDAVSSSSSSRSGTQLGLLSAAAGVVMVRTEGSWGSGVVVSNTGLVLTVAHLFRKRSTAAVQAGRHACVSDGHVSELSTGAAMVPEHLLGCASSMHKLHLSTFDSVQKSESGVQAALAAQRVYTLDHHQQQQSAAGDGEGIHIRITVNSGSSGSKTALWVPAKVLYCFSSYLDLAVLQILPSSLKRLPSALLQPLQLVTKECDVTPGSDVYVVGHGLFGPNMGLNPAVTAGCVAAVVKLPVAADLDKLLAGQQQPAGDHEHHQQHLQGTLPCAKPSMVISTAAVHSGASGGALVDPAGYLAGLVTSNARHAGGQTLPHMNFCISAEELRPVWEWSQRQQQQLAGSDSALLQQQQQQQLKQLDADNAAGAKLWALQPYMHANDSAGCC